MIGPKITPREPTADDRIIYNELRDQGFAPEDAWASTFGISDALAKASPEPGLSDRELLAGELRTDLMPNAANYIEDGREGSVFGGRAALRAIARARTSPAPVVEGDACREVLRKTHQLIADFAVSGFTNERLGKQLYSNQAIIHAALSQPSSPPKGELAQQLMSLRTALNTGAGLSDPTKVRAFQATLDHLEALATRTDPAGLCARCGGVVMSIDQFYSPRSAPADKELALAAEGNGHDQ